MNSYAVMIGGGALGVPRMSAYGESGIIGGARSSTPWPGTHSYVRDEWYSPAAEAVQNPHQDSLLVVRGD